MIKLSIEIETDKNQAFDNQRVELARILSGAAWSILHDDEGLHPIRDLNGNLVGRINFKLEAE